MTGKHLIKRPDTISLVVVVGHLLMVVSPVYLAAVVGPGWQTVGFWLFFGLSMNGVLNLMHECSHFHVFKERWGSEILGKWIIAPFVFADFSEYRRRHWDHHRFLGEEGETKDAYLIDVRGTAIFRLLARCLLMRVAAGMFLKQTQEGAHANRRGLAWLRNVVVFQLVFVLSVLLTAWAFNASKGWLMVCYYASAAYGFVYLYGLMSLTVLMASLRAIAEHQQYDEASARAGYAALRNFSCTPLSRFLMGAYGFGEHYSHHRRPGIPYYHLGTATRDMADEDALLRPGKDYFTVLAEIVLR